MKKSLITLLVISMLSFAAQQSQANPAVAGPAALLISGFLTTSYPDLVKLTLQGRSETTYDSIVGSTDGTDKSIHDTADTSSPVPQKAVMAKVQEEAVDFLATDSEASPLLQATLDGLRAYAEARALSNETAARIIKLNDRELARLILSELK